MERHRDRYAVEKMCKVLKVSRNAYYYWRRTHTTEAPESSKEMLKDAIRAVFEESRQIYGSYKIAKELSGKQKGVNILEKPRIGCVGENLIAML